MEKPVESKVVTVTEKFTYYKVICEYCKGTGVDSKTGKKCYRCMGCKYHIKAYRN